MGQLYIAYGVIYGFILIAGICIGSFLNVLIYRIPEKISFAKGRSFCPACGHELRAIDLVPVISFLFLKGKCRYCGDKISFRYPLIELLGGAFALWSALSFGLTWQAVVGFAVSCILLVIAFIDIDTMEIPDGLVLALLVLAVVSLICFRDITWISGVIGFFVISLPMLLMNLIIKDSFGGGDIKLCAACGLMLGWQQMLAAALIALVTGGIYGAYLLITKKKDRKDHFAFGPFLSFGIIVALFAGNFLIQSYLAIFNLA
ncbi:prepilin peptidase [Anaerovorax odorimutans]|uniref:Prepilin leader peptidase/N-methyltransferase n=1 Tax=Anaerovorax odorimutans TaxID=109327 RepID=A0ABT1RS43_9FIRM|nr:A24 family peptidase [Anaerovorax odorimutans]MCQ4638023.1 prepilin peptidase [Anaerovorax odorimutans]